ncbi:MAG: hypothetical protein KatS3mg051_1775 [Anaerolineae bacterium]|nr:MAG: hypothetical protein KatS3mg051_1775 [Anaerolineae bacterium]
MPCKLATHELMSLHEQLLSLSCTLNMQASVPLPGLGRFITAGQWVNPGGVPTCLIPERDAVRILVKSRP